MRCGEDAIKCSKRVPCELLRVLHTRCAASEPLAALEVSTFPTVAPLRGSRT
jgi:hypothetical protein